MNESKQFVSLIEEYRASCLWFLRKDLMPSDRDAQIRVLDCIERYGDRSAFIQTRRLKQWLSLHSSETFAVS